MQDPKPLLTLKEWCDRVGTSPTHPTTEKGAVSVVSNEKSIGHQLLWHLTDYTVSQVQAKGMASDFVVVWLLPRLPEQSDIPQSLCQNLDCMDEDDLNAYAVGAARTINVLRDLFDYAMNKSKAAWFRKRGLIENALVLEKNCDRIYKQLPIEARW